MKKYPVIVGTLFSVSEQVFSLGLTEDWRKVCETKVLSVYDRNPGCTKLNTPCVEFVDGNGKVVGNPDSNSTWGITAPYCYEHCGGINTRFDFTSFSAAATNWLLPWVALTAQLPFETGGPFHNVMSLLLCVGSPLHAAYGLVITMLSRRRISARFSRILRRASNDEVRFQYPHLKEAIGHARYVVQSSHQASMRAFEGSGWLSRLILLAGSTNWWASVRTSLQAGERGVTLSLIFQIIFAVIAWLWTIIAAFQSLGNVTTANSIAVSGLWTFLLPLIIGWVAVSTQRKSGSIEEALRAGGDSTTSEQSQNGIAVWNGVLPEVSLSSTEINEGEELLRGSSDHDGETHELRSVASSRQYLSPNRQFSLSSLERRDSTETSHWQTHNHGQNNAEQGETSTTNLNAQTEHTGVEPRSDIARHERFSEIIPSYWSFELTGDERNEGPIYNYARIWSHAQFAETIANGFETVIQKIERKKTPTGAPWSNDLKVHQNLRGSAKQISRYCDFDGPLAAYPPFTFLGGRIWRDIIVAILFGMFILGGTAGPSIYIAYNSPPVGLGCRSATISLYVTLAVAAWACLWGSSILSHALMLRYQKARKTPTGVFPLLFVVTRVLGNLIAALNALWLFLSSIFILAGVYDNCWCNSDFLVYGDRGLVLLFEHSAQLRHAAQPIWLGASIFVITAAVVSIGFVWLGCKDANSSSSS